MKVKLVSSLAGKHEEWDQVLRTGHPALMSAIQSLGARAGKSKDLTIECQVRIPSLTQLCIKYSLRTGLEHRKLHYAMDE